MKNWKKLLLTVVPATLAVSFTAFAGQWSQDMNGWRYENDDGSYCRNGWYWLDGNQDGIAECYIFDNDGYAQVSLYNLTAKAGGYEVNDQGAWVVDGVVQEKKVEVPAAEIQPAEEVKPDASNDPAALEAYLAAQEKTNTLDSMDAQADMKMSMTMEGVSIDTNMDMNMKVRGAQTGNLEFVADGSMTMLGSDIPFQMFYTDNMYYMDMMGMKMKQEMPLDEALDQVASNLESVDMDLAMMNDMAMTTEDGNTVLTYGINTDNMNSFLNGIVGDMDTLYNGYTVSYNIRSASGKAIVDENGCELDMGTAFDYFGREAAPEFYEGDGQSEEIRQNRRLLYYSMIDAGFVPDSVEWWHFNYGNSAWAKWKGCAPIYGGIFSL